MFIQSVLFTEPLIIYKHSYSDLLPKQSHMCVVCHRSRFNHTFPEIKICKSKMRKTCLDLKRVSFPKTVQDQAIERQKGKCYYCNWYWRHAEFHHVEGRNDSSLDNCVVVCRDCHLEVERNKRGSFWSIGTITGKNVLIVNHKLIWVLPAEVFFGGFVQIVKNGGEFKYASSV